MRNIKCGGLCRNHLRYNGVWAALGLQRFAALVLQASKY